MSAGRALFVATLVGLASACSRGTPPRDEPSSDGAVKDVVRDVAAEIADAQTVDVAVARPARPPDVRPAFLDAKLLGGKAIGHTSVVLKVRLEGGLEAAWKPNTRRGKNRFRGEVAARRLALALGLDAVPEAGVRCFGRDELLRLTSGATRELLEAELVADPDGRVPGAILPWIHDLTFPEIEREPLLSRWKRGLEGSRDAGNADDMPVLADMSTLLVFDSLTGNWDRMSGANVGRDPRTGRLLFVDNDGAFYETPPPDGLARNTRLLHGTKRFSATFVAALDALDETSLAAVMGHDHRGRPLLSDKALAGLAARLRDTRAYVAKARGDGALDLP